MDRTRRLVTALALATMLAFVMALPAAAATITIVQGRVIGCDLDQSPAYIVNRTVTNQRGVSGKYTDPRTGRTVYYWYRIRIPLPTPTPEPPTPTPDPKPQPEPQPDPRPQPDPQPRPEPQPQPSESELTAEERQMFDLVNRERAAAGKKPLALDPRLVEQARLKSQDMSQLGYFDHYSPTYGTPFDQMKKAGIAYRAAGENLAGAPTVQMAHDGLMNSPGHKANILNDAYTHVGIGVAKSGRYGLLFTQMFIAKP